MKQLINFKSKEEVTEWILKNITQNDNRYDRGTDIIEILSFFLINKAILIEENKIPYMTEPTNEIFKKIKGPQEYHKFIALQLLLSRNIEREKIIFERSFIGRKVDVYAEIKDKTILIECCSCSIQKVIEYLEEENTEMWIITDGFGPWDNELLKFGRSQWFILTRGDVWNECYTKYKKVRDEDLKKVEPSIRKLERV